MAGWLLAIQGEPSSRALRDIREHDIARVNDLRETWANRLTDSELPHPFRVRHALISQSDEIKAAAQVLTTAHVNALFQTDARVIVDALTPKQPLSRWHWSRDDAPDWQAAARRIAHPAEAVLSAALVNVDAGMTNPREADYEVPEPTRRFWARHAAALRHDAINTWTALFDERDLLVRDLLQTAASGTIEALPPLARQQLNVYVMSGEQLIEAAQKFADLTLIKAVMESTYDARFFHLQEELHVYGNDPKTVEYIERLDIERLAQPTSVESTERLIQLPAPQAAALSTSLGAATEL